MSESIKYFERDIREDYLRELKDIFHSHFDTEYDFRGFLNEVVIKNYIDNY